VIDAAAMIAYTSILHADTNPISLAESHRDTERLIEASGILADGSRTLSRLISRPTETLRATILRTIGRAATPANAR
jgi:hypothetical protein